MKQKRLKKGHKKRTRKKALVFVDKINREPDERKHKRLFSLVKQSANSYLFRCFDSKRKREAGCILIRGRDGKEKQRYKQPNPRHPGRKKATKKNRKIEERGR